MNEPFKIGDKVTTKYYSEQSNIIRTVLRVTKSKAFGSGYGLTVDGGKACKCCGLRPGDSIKNIDSSWFKKIIVLRR